MAKIATKRHSFHWSHRSACIHSSHRAHNLNTSISKRQPDWSLLLWCRFLSAMFANTLAVNKRIKYAQGIEGNNKEKNWREVCVCGGRTPGGGAVWRTNWRRRRKWVGMSASMTTFKSSFSGIRLLTADIRSFLAPSLILPSSLIVFCVYFTLSIFFAICCTHTDYTCIVIIVLSRQYCRCGNIIDMYWSYVPLLLYNWFHHFPFDFFNISCHNLALFLPWLFNYYCCNCSAFFNTVWFCTTMKKWFQKNILKDLMSIVEVQCLHD